MTELNWENLKELRCPDCYEDLIRSGDRARFACSAGDCGFNITEIRLREIVEEMFTKAGDHFGRADFEELMEGEK